MHKTNSLPDYLFSIYLSKRFLKSFTNMDTTLVSPATAAPSAQYEQVYAMMTAKLEKDLPAYLSYHNASHTKDVVEAAVFIGKEEGISNEEMLLLSTAALFHDT